MSRRPKSTSASDVAAAVDDADKLIALLNSTLSSSNTDVVVGSSKNNDIGSGTHASIKTIATGNWDDGEECRDASASGCGILELWCARCGDRPRPEHLFRCRQHDSDVANAETRPVAPLPLNDEAAEQLNPSEWVALMGEHDQAMTAHKYAMDLWQPEWRDETQPTTAADVPDQQYPLPCVRCRHPTAVSGRAGEEFHIDFENVRLDAPWLPVDYDWRPSPGRRGDAGNAASMLCVRLGQRGVCMRCQLVISLSPWDEAGSEEEELSEGEI